MQKTASIRELRNHFPRIRKIMETEGEVLLTESGKPKYRLAPYTAPRPKVVPAIDYWARLNSYQSKPLSSEESEALNDENRGNR